MPRRTNDFQTLIALIERQIAQAGVTVTESQLVKDHVIREDREVDVHLVVNHGQATTTVGIECVAVQRRADITWVEGKIQKHRDLGTDRLVLVSRSGFTKSARKKAKQHGAVTLTLEQATAADWASLPKSPFGLRVDGMQLVSVGIAVPYGSQLDMEVPKGEPPLGPDPGRGRALSVRWDPIRYGEGDPGEGEIGPSHHGGIRAPGAGARR